MSTAIRRSLPFVFGGLAVVAVVALIAYSYSVPPRFDYNGDWIGNRDLAGPNPEIAYTLGRVTLTIKDGHFDSTSGGMPTGGSVIYERDHVVLHAETIAGVPLSRAGSQAEKSHPDITVRPRKDGTVSFEDPRALDDKPLVLKRTKLMPGG